MLNYLNGVNEIGAFENIKAKRKAKLIKRKAIKQKALNTIVKKQVSQVQKANILNNAINKANAVKQISPLTVTRIKKQAVIDMNRKNFEEEGEPIVSEIPNEIIESANEKFDNGLEEVQSPENLNPDEADSDEGGEEIGKLKDYFKKGGIKKAFKDAKANVKERTKNLGQKVRKYTPVIALARASFLTLLKFNVFKLRNKIAQGYKKNPKKIENWWVNSWGGNLNVLLKNLKVSKIGMIGEPVTIATAIVAASGVVVSIIDVLKSMNIQVNKNENPPLKEPETEQPEAEQPEAEQPETKQPEEEQPEAEKTNNEDMTPIEENAEMGVYYPFMTSKKKKNPIKNYYSTYSSSINKNARPNLSMRESLRMRKKLNGIKKIPKMTKKPRVKGQGLDKFNKGLTKFQSGLDKTKNLLDITKSATTQIFQGKPAIKAQKALTSYKAEVKSTNMNKNIFIYGGIGAIALLLLMKKK